MTKGPIMKKLTFGLLVGFFAGIYSIFALLWGDKEARSLMADLVSRFVFRLIYGEEIPVRRRTTYANPVPRYSYQRNVPKRIPHQRPAGSVGNDYIFTTREEAEQVLDEMKKLLISYCIVTLGDLNDLIGFPRSHADNKKGWRNLTNAQIQQVRLGYCLLLPDFEEITTPV